MSEPRWKCRECDLVSASSELLRAPSPFSATDNLVACPGCREVGDNAFLRLCDVPDCADEASIGTPTPSGYHYTCGKHAPPSDPVGLGNPVTEGD